MMLSNQFQKLLTCWRECSKKSTTLIGPSAPLLSALLLIFLVVALAKRQNDTATTSVYFKPSAQNTEANLPVIMANMSKQDFLSLHHRLLQSTGWHSSVLSQRKILIDNEEGESDNPISLRLDTVASASKADQHNQNTATDSARMTTNSDKTSVITTKTDRIINHTVNMNGFVEANAVSTDGHGEIILSNEDKKTTLSDPVEVLGSNTNTIDTADSAREEQHVE